jgi:predicted N-formylglutamate amidohydrolase
MTLTPLLSPDEPHPVRVDNPDGASPILLVADHYGRLIPRRLGQLGLSAAELDRHIAWDIGIAGVSARLADALDAALISQLYSRLVIDCNRPPDAQSAVPLVSETTAIPGNEGLGDAERRARIAEVFAPYHDRVSSEIARRRAAGRPTILVAMHSFTPVYKGEARPWRIGTLYGRDARLASRLHPLLVEEAGLVVGDNQPYAVSDETDYTIPVHGEGNGLVHVGLEIRQDLIVDVPGQEAWAERLARLLPLAANEAAAGALSDGVFARTR